MDQNTFQKRVLIISGCSLSDNSATSITIRSYFEKWPKDKLVILSPLERNQSFAKTLFLNPPLLFYLRTFLVKHLLKNEQGSINKNVVPASIVNNSTNRITIKQKIFSIGAAYIDLLNFRISKKVQDELDDFNPQIIYTIMGNRRTIAKAISLSTVYKIRIVPHFMDDWISTMYTGSFLLKLPRILLINSLRKLLLHSIEGFCISKKMCEEYENRFNKPFLPLMNIIDSTIFSLKKVNPEKENEKIFSYFGGLHLNRWKSLLAFSSILNLLSKELGNNLILEIYTNNDDINRFSSLFIYPNVAFHNSLKHDLACEKMTQTDFLIHVESFDANVVSYTRLSISTKIPEYLASGTPILAIGPANIASIEYLKDNNCAYIIDDMDNSLIRDTILSAIQGHSNSVYLQNSLTLVNENHSENQYDIFRKVLTKN